ncbi:MULTISPECIES: GNAT family N-acetyltransferase [unclassified Microbacterium]|uniref:GNAT family N-acetyltransferase n=1 Tax=unclassified Microbacterium TaxID=2609290 RepID=UPI003864BFE6
MTPEPLFTFRPLHVPASIDDHDAGDFIGMTHARNTVFREISGDDDENMTPAQLLPFFAPDPDGLRYTWVVLVDDQVVGRMLVDVPLEDGSAVAFWLIELISAVHGRGIARALYPTIEDTARTHGRTALQSWGEHHEPGAGHLDAPTGFGSIPLDRPARFFRNSGHALEQVVRKSALDLTGQADLSSMQTIVARGAQGYRIEQWTLPTPQAYEASYAYAKSRMSTDAPAAGLEVDEEVWDVERLRRNDERYLASGRTVLVTAAVDEATGEVVAFNELVSGTDLAAATHQEDTLVLREHRGHRLGMLVKSAGIVRWREIAPASPRIITYNAEENRPMLDINEALGFVPVAYEGAWQKTLV